MKRAPPKPPRSYFASLPDLSSPRPADGVNDAFREAGELAGGWRDAAVYELQTEGVLLVGTVDRRGRALLDPLAGWPFGPWADRAPYRNRDGEIVGEVEFFAELWAELGEEWP